VTTGLKVSSLFGLLLMLVACNNNRVYDAYMPIDSKGWHADSIASFELEVLDTSSRYAVYLNLRHNHEYPFRNIWFFRTISSKQGIEYTDTINYILADDMGKWLGSGIGETKNVIMPFKKEALFFNKKGNHIFEVQHGMTDTVLMGISEVGLEVFAQAPNE
jgi:gliding motility-associated lipoprotein GldH